MSTVILPEHANALSAFDHVQRTRLVFGNGTASRAGELAGELGLTHLLTMGRPDAYELSEKSAETFGPWIRWLAYSFNVASECGAFFTLCIAYCRWCWLDA